MTVRILQGDAREVLKTLADESVHCVVTSPPYWGLRDYGVEGQLGLELTPQAYVERMVAVFREVRRVLRSDGTLWLNMGDSYATGAGAGAVGQCPGGGEQGARWAGRPVKGANSWVGPGSRNDHKGRGTPLRADGSEGRKNLGPMTQPNRMPQEGTTRNKRSVWTVTTQPFKEAHFATFPSALIEPCILAGCPGGGTVLDPFFGAGTTGFVADRLGRDCIGIELNPEYVEMAERRMRGTTPALEGLTA